MNSVQLQDTKSTYSNLLFPYTNNETLVRKRKLTIPFIVASQRMKHLGINLPRKLKTCTLETMRD